MVLHLQLVNHFVQKITRGARHSGVSDTVIWSFRFFKVIQNITTKLKIFGGVVSGS